MDTDIQGLDTDIDNSLKPWTQIYKVDTDIDNTCKLRM